MELNQDNRTICAPLTVLDTVAEQLADVDVTLPDYCPDIEKILKCTLIPKVQSRTLSGGQLLIEGYCVVNVLYVESEKKTVRCCEQNVNFSQSFSVRDTSGSYVIMTKTKSEYINCRALSPRRLVIHGAFSLYAKVIATKTTTLYTPEDENLEILKKNIACSDLKSICQEQFSVSEEISVADKPEIESLLYSDVTAYITDAKAVTGKLMVNGEISLKIFYLTDVESGQTAKLDYILPFSQIIDCEGAEENNHNIVNCEVLSFDVRLKNDMLSDKPAIALDVKLCVTEEGYLPMDEYIITDAYSTEYATTLAYSDLSMIGETVPVNESCIEKINAKIDNCKISKLLDIYTDFITVDSSVCDDGIKVSGKINLGIIALNEDNYPVFIERSQDYEHLISGAESCNDFIFGSVRPASISYRLADANTIEIRVELKIYGGAVQNESHRSVSNVEVHEDMPLNTDNCALMLYFASQGENLWDIAKAHNTGLDMLMSENELDNMILENQQMLLIPKI